MSMDDRYFGNLALKNFQEINVPDTIHWLPLAPGWTWVGMILLLLLIYKTLQAIKKYRANAYRRSAIKQLETLQHDFEQGRLDKKHYLLQLRQLLKATALHAFERPASASLTGEQWIAFLNQKTPTPLFNNSSDLMSQRVYQSRPDTDTSQLKRFATDIGQWILQHHD